MKSPQDRKESVYIIKNVMGKEARVEQPIIYIFLTRTRYGKIPGMKLIQQRNIILRIEVMWMFILK